MLGKSVVSPVGQYIKTGQLPVARVRGSADSMGTIRESAESRVRESAESSMSSGKMQLLVYAG